MGQALAGFAVFLIVVGGIMITLTRRTRNKLRETLAAEGETAMPLPPQGKKQRVLAEMAPVKARPTIQDLVDEEAEATGVNDIPGGEELNVSLKLRVFWRDEVVRSGCDDGHLEFRIDKGVDLESIRTEDVRLVCVRPDQAAADSSGTDPADEVPGDEDSE